MTTSHRGKSATGKGSKKGAKSAVSSAKAVGKAVAASASAAATAAPSAVLQVANQRLTVLEGHVAALNEHVGLPATGADEEMQPVTFSLAAGSCDYVRLTLDGKESFILGSSPHDSLPRANDTVIAVFLETWGSPGQQASVVVTNASPTPLTSKVLTSSYTFDDRSLKTHF
jgi:hypothetical protein